MRYFFVLLPFIIAFALYLPLSAKVFFGEFEFSEGGRVKDDYFTSYIFLQLITLRIEMFALALSAAAFAVNLLPFIFQPPDLADIVRVNFIISLIAVAVAILAAIFRRMVERLRFHLTTLLRFIFFVIDNSGEEDREAMEMASFVLFSLNSLFTLREKYGLLKEVIYDTAPDEDADSISKRALRTYCQRMIPVLDHCQLQDSEMATYRRLVALSQQA